MHVAKILPPLLVLVLLGLGGWRISQYIASKHHAFESREFAQAHPLLPWIGLNQQMSQNGYTLLAIQSVSPLDTYSYVDAQGPQRIGPGRITSETAPETDMGLWIQLDSLPLGIDGGSDWRWGGDSAPFLSITGRSSAGDTFPLWWEITNNQGNRMFLLASIPGGYPDTWKFVDVTVADKHGQLAQWRISNLLPMQHLFPSPVTVEDTFQASGISVKAYAWRSKVPGRDTGVINYTIRGHQRPGAQAQDLQITGVQWEWAASLQTQPGYHRTFAFDSFGKLNGFDYFDFSEMGQPMAFAKYDKYLRLSGKIQPCRFYKEFVTFHNIPVQRNRSGSFFLAPLSTLTQTTPSGVSVSLPDAATERAAMDDVPDYGQPNCLNYLMKWSPQNTVLLPGSPLCGKYHRPVSVLVTAHLVGIDYQSWNRNYEGNVMSYSLLVLSSQAKRDLRKNRTLKSLTFLVRQRVDLQPTSLAFIVPIGSKPVP